MMEISSNTYLFFCSLLWDINVFVKVIVWNGVAMYLLTKYKVKSTYNKLTVYYNLLLQENITQLGGYSAR